MYIVLLANTKIQQIFEKSLFYWDFLRVGNFSNYVIKNEIAITQRTGNWVQEFYRIDDLLTYINTQFGDKSFVESILKQEE